MNNEGPVPEVRAPQPTMTGLICPGSRPAEVVAFEESVVAFFMDAAQLLGVPKSVAAIYGVCFASPEPLSFSEIDERLDISSGSISQGLRVLRDAGALKTASARKKTTAARNEAGNGATDGQKEEPAPPSARSAVRYEPDLELRNLVLRWMEQRLQKQLKSGGSRLDAIVKSVPPSLASVEVLQTRFESLQTWHNKARSLLPLVKTFLKLT